MRLLAVLLLLSACAHPMPPPDLLEPCRSAVLPPAAPKPPRTAAVLARWSIQIQLAREETADRLVECSRRVDGWIEWAARK